MLGPGFQRLDSRGVVNGKLARHGLDARRIDLEPYEGGDVIPELFRLGDSDHSSLCTISMAVRSRLFIRASYRGKSLERGQLRDQTPIEYVKPIGKRPSRAPKQRVQRGQAVNDPNPIPRPPAGQSGAARLAIALSYDCNGPAGPGDHSDDGLQEAGARPTATPHP